MRVDPLLGIRQENAARCESTASDTIDESSMDEILRAVFGLTSREAALARELASGRSLAAATKCLGRETSTERSRLKEVFAKMDVTRQAKLVKRILDVASHVGRDKAR